MAGMSEMSSVAREVMMDDLGTDRAMWLRTVDTAAHSRPVDLEALEGQRRSNIPGTAEHRRAVKNQSAVKAWASLAENVGEEERELSSGGQAHREGLATSVRGGSATRGGRGQRGGRGGGAAGRGGRQSPPLLATQPHTHRRQINVTGQDGQATAINTARQSRRNGGGASPRGRSPAAPMPATLTPTPRQQRGESTAQATRAPSTARPFSGHLVSGADFMASVQKNFAQKARTTIAGTSAPPKTHEPKLEPTKGSSPLESTSRTELQILGEKQRSPSKEHPKVRLPVKEGPAGRSAEKETPADLIDLTGLEAEPREPVSIHGRKRQQIIEELKSAKQEYATVSTLPPSNRITKWTADVQGVITNLEQELASLSASTQPGNGQPVLAPRARRNQTPRTADRPASWLEELSEEFSDRPGTSPGQEESQEKRPAGQPEAFQIPEPTEFAIEDRGHPGHVRTRLGFPTNSFGSAKAARGSPVLLEDAERIEPLGVEQRATGPSSSDQKDETKPPTRTSKLVATKVEVSRTTSGPQSKVLSSGTIAKVQPKEEATPNKTVSQPQQTSVSQQPKLQNPLTKPRAEASGDNPQAPTRTGVSKHEASTSAFSTVVQSGVGSSAQRPDHSPAIQGRATTVSTPDIRPAASSTTAQSRAGSTIQGGQSAQQPMGVREIPNLPSSAAAQQYARNPLMRETPNLPSSPAAQQYARSSAARETPVLPSSAATQQYARSPVPPPPQGPLRIVALYPASGEVTQDSSRNRPVVPGSEAPSADRQAQHFAQQPGSLSPRPSHSVAGSRWAAPQDNIQQSGPSHARAPSSATDISAGGRQSRQRTKSEEEDEKRRLAEINKPMFPHFQNYNEKRGSIREVPAFVAESSMMTSPPDHGAAARMQYQIRPTRDEQEDHPSRGESSRLRH